MRQVQFFLEPKERQYSTREHIGSVISESGIHYTLGGTQILMDNKETERIEDQYDAISMLIAGTGMSEKFIKDNFYVATVNV